jgi:hypothetical protein
VSDFRLYRCSACKAQIRSTIPIESCPFCDDIVYLVKPQHPIIGYTLHRAEADLEELARLERNRRKTESKRRQQEAARHVTPARATFTDDAISREVERELPILLAEIEARLQAEVEMDKYGQN